MLSEPGQGQRVKSGGQGGGCLDSVVGRPVRPERGGRWTATRGQQVMPKEWHAERGGVVGVLGSSGEGRQGQVSEALRGVWIFSPVESRTSAELQNKMGGRGRVDPRVGKIPWRKNWQPTLVLLPGKSHGQWSLAVMGVPKSWT